MKRNFLLVLLFTIIIGIQPALAQSKNDAPSKPAAPQKPVKEAKEAGTVININLASDKDFSQALETATDVELVSEDAAKNDKNDKKPNQGQSKPQGQSK